MRSLTLSVLVSLLVFASCKKDSKEPTPPTPVQADEQLNPANGKISHYLFNGNIRDTSGNSHHGGEASSIAYGPDRFNRANRALALNGTSTDFETGGLGLSFPFSYSFWMNAADPSAIAALFQSDRTTGAYYGSWLQLSVASANKLAFSFGDGTGSSGGSRNSLLSSVALSANQWYHIVINVRGANDMDLYINGAKDNSASYDGSATSIAYSSPNPSSVIGSAFENQNFNGRIDDLRIYNRVLTATEVNSLYSFQP
ncbi:MAG: LamG domain-containing protein [Chitinophagaceae bacterium]|nr:LamG domain-containing protein [Chitinophagaceae bacterium]